MTALKYLRRPFTVDAFEVTEENLEEVAKWCNGDIEEASHKPGKPLRKCVRVRVLRPLNERQTKAFPGNFVVHAGTGYKVYTRRAFHDSFELKVEDDHDYGKVLAES